MNLVAATVALSLAPHLMVAAAPGPFSEEDIRNMRTIMDAIYRTDYRGSTATCRKLIATSPADPIGYVFLARTLWQEELSRSQALALNRFAAPDFFVENQTVKYKLQPDSTMEAEFNRISQDAVAKAKDQLKTAPEDLRAWFLLGLAYQNVATFNASLQGSWRKAFFAGENTRRAHQRVYVRYPAFADALVSLGVYEYVAGSVNWFYRMWGAMLGISGDKQRGLTNLEKAAREATFLPGDAKSMLVLIYTRERNYQKAYDRLAELRRDYPENYFVPMDQGTLALKMNRPAEAVTIYRSLLDQMRKSPANSSGFESSAVLNQLGIAYRMDGKLDESASALEQVVSSDATSSRVKAVAHLELGKTRDLQGRRQDAVRHYQEVQALDDAMGSREEADRLLRRPFQQSAIP